MSVTQMNLGRVRPVYKGAYSSSATYVTLDMVLYQSEIWMMVARSYTPGDLPVDSGNGMSASGAWAKIGYRGLQGIQGATGPVGPYYTPSVAVDGTISWTNNGGLTNPNPVKLDLFWHTISGTCTQVSTTQFTVAGTESVIAVGRGVRINDAYLAHITAVSVANDVTTVTIDSTVVPATITKVEVAVLNTDMLPTLPEATQLAAGYMSAEDKTKLDNTATTWTDLGTKLMTARVLRSVLYNILGVAGYHYADGHLNDLNYQTAMVTIFNGWNEVYRANYPTGAASRWCVSLLVPFNYDLQNNTPFYEFSCCQILLSESGDVWARKKENGSWSSWSYKNSVTPIDGTLTKKIDIGVGTTASRAFRVGSMGFVVINDSFPSVNTEYSYYQVYETDLKAVKETTAPVYDFSGRIVGYAWVNSNGVVFIRGLYTGTPVGALYSCIQYPVSV